MEFVFAIILAAVIGYVILAWKMKLFPFKGKVIGTVKDGRQQAIIDSLTEYTYIPPKVYSRSPLSIDIKNGIADAFDERITTAKSKGWTKGLNPVDYTIYVFPSVRDLDADGNYSPVFQVFLPKGDPYNGSEYDHGGWIYAAEQVLTEGDQLTDTFIIAANNSREYTQRVVSYALDHLFAYKNDRELYERTKNHANGGQHPLW